ncbi:Uncharacterised protein [Bordetella pertussis]|nr:Uncharacterised protein [Bordetella pertussis]CFW35436.1 Uncharacterised protein [Bordetella pertussis]CPL53358.1 Uncharacterised protein [Bordetella pertussis]CPN47196.1 Uncharacterised protein [Bordetella pertussis]
MPPPTTSLMMARSIDKASAWRTRLSLNGLVSARLPLPVLKKTSW